MIASEQVNRSQLRSYGRRLDTEREASVSGHTYGKVIAQHAALVQRGNAPDASLLFQNPKVHEYAEVRLDSPHDVGTINNGDPTLARATEVLYDGKQRRLEDRPILLDPLTSVQLGHSRAHELGNQRYEASSDLQIEFERPSTKGTGRGRRLGRRLAPEVTLPDEEALARGPSSRPGSAPPTPRSQNAYSSSRAATKTASSSGNLPTAGTFIFNTTTIIMAIVALAFAIMGYKVGVSSTQSGDRALKLSMWEDCIEHSDILANSSTCRKLLDQGFDAIVGTRGAGERFRGRRGLEDDSDRCPCCYAELDVG